MGVGDRQLHPAPAAAGQALAEGAPEMSPPRGRSRTAPTRSSLAWHGVPTVLWLIPARPIDATGIDPCPSGTAIIRSPRAAAWGLIAALPTSGRRPRRVSSVRSPVRAQPIRPPMSAAIGSRTTASATLRSKSPSPAVASGPRFSAPLGTRVSVATPPQPADPMTTSVAQRRRAAARPVRSLRPRPPVGNAHHQSARYLSQLRRSPRQWGEHLLTCRMFA